MYKMPQRILERGGRVMQEKKDTYGQLMMTKEYCGGCKASDACYARGIKGILSMCPIFREFFDEIYKKAQEVE